MDVDPISQLPNHLIHLILSFLPTTDLIRVSVWSKAWHAFFTSFCISDFCLPEGHSLEKNIKFANFVYSSLRRQRRQYRSIPKFKLSITQYRRPGHDCKWRQIKDLVFRSIGLCMTHGVKELSLNIHPSIKFIMDEPIFLTRELSHRPIYYPSMRELSVEGLTIGDPKTIEYLSSSCPVLEKFALINCLRLDHLRLSGFPRLKKVKVINDIKNGIKKIEIDHVLGLQSFSYLGADEGTAADIHLTGCRNLEVLELKNFRITTNFEFPALKVLVLQKHGIERIEISSPRLEKLVIDPPMEAVINAPRL